MQLKLIHNSIVLSLVEVDYFYLYLLGSLYDNLGKYKKAIYDYNKVIDINPHSDDAYYNRGWI